MERARVDACRATSHARATSRVRESGRARGHHAPDRQHRRLRGVGRRAVTREAATRVDGGVRDASRAMVHTKLGRAVSVRVERDERAETFTATVTLERRRDDDEASSSIEHLRVHCGLTRESVREWMCSEELPEGATYDEGTSAMRIPFDETTRAASVYVPEYAAPASLDFVLYDESTGTYDEPSGAPVGSAFSVPMGFGLGHARELGATTSTYDAETRAGEFNFAVLSKHATACALVLQYGENTMELALNPVSHRTGNVWHVSVPFGGPRDVLHAPTRDDDVRYAFRFEGDPEGRGGSRFYPAQVLFDPRAIELASPLSEMEEPTPTPRFMGSLAAALERGVVGDASSPPVAAVSDVEGRSTTALDVDVSTLTREGTLRAAVGEIQRLRSTMYFNAVTLAPLQARSPDDRPDSPVSFFAIDPRFGTRADLRAFVSAMKTIGVDVWMRVVVTQTGEGTDASPRSESLRGVDAASYFQLDHSGGLDSAGVPMTTALNPCSAATIELLVDALRTFATYDGVSSFVVETGGGIVRGPLGRSPLLETLAHDAVLGNAAKKLWLTPSANECGSMPSWGTIGEINSKFAETVENFFRGASGALNDMALRLGGSPDIFRSVRDSRHGMNAFHHPAPACSIPPSCAVPKAASESSDPMARAELAALFTSTGGVLLSAHGLDVDLLPLASELSRFRASRSDVFNDDTAVDHLRWLDPVSGASPRFDDAFAPPILACLRRDTTGQNRDVWIGYNGTDAGVATNLPIPPSGFQWIRLFDTSLAADASAPTPWSAKSYVIGPRSTSILEIRPFTAPSASPVSSATP